MSVAGKAYSVDPSLQQLVLLVALAVGWRCSVL
jgi:hypothetical protein